MRSKERSCLLLLLGFAAVISCVSAQIAADRPQGLSVIAHPPAGDLEVRVHA